MLIEDFVKVERELYLLDRNYKDFPYWVYARYAIFSYLTKIEDGIALNNQELEGLFCGIISMLFNSLNFIGKCKRKKKQIF